MTYNQTLERTNQRRYEAYFEAEFDRLWQDETTWAAETLDAPFQKDLEFHLEGEELYSKQGQRLSEIFDTGTEYYRELAESDPSLMFQYYRSLLERKELDKMQAMARGKGGNTLVVVSNYPKELKDANQDVIGYQHQRKLGFIRVIKRVGPGRISMWVHSFDRNDPDAIKEMYAYMGREVDLEQDTVGQMVELDLSDEEQELYGDQLLFIHDEVLSEKLGENCFAGRTESDRREAVGFVEAQPDLVTAHVKALIDHGRKPGFLSDQRYDFSMALRRRHKGKKFLADSVLGEMGGAGNDGRARGETASGCGYSVEASTSAQLSEAGYKLASGERHSDPCMQCPQCQKFGVLVERKGDKTFYTCENTQCGATTKPKKQQALPLQRSIPFQRQSTKPNEGTKRQLIKRKYGDHMEISRVIEIGGSREVIVNRWTGEEVTD